MSVKPEPRLDYASQQRRRLSIPAEERCSGCHGTGRKQLPRRPPNDCCTGRR